MNCVLPGTVYIFVCFSSEEDFDAVYPESSLSYGPTICSFGLKYNDHNYALPSGLTPPFMAPHLMDSHPRDARSEGTCSQSLFSDEHRRCKRPVESENPGTVNSEILNVSDTPSVLSNADPGRLAAETEATYRYSNTNLTLTPEDCSQDPFSSSRHNKPLSAYEQMEMRYEPELKVVEVPEELAVSPSRLSDLDSELSDDGYSNQEVMTVNSAHRNLVIDGSLLRATCVPIHCLCGRAFFKTMLIQCPSCKVYQHANCMESHYNLTLPNLCDGYVCPRCGSDGSSVHPSSQTEVSKLLASSDSPSQPECTVTSSADAVTSTRSETAAPSAFSEECKDVAKRLTISEGAAGAQYVEVTVDRARRLGLISNLSALEGALCSKPSFPMNLPKLGDRHTSRDMDNRIGTHAGVDWERLNELSRSTRRAHGDTNVNLRVPSPPRASKRKQDLTTTSYNDADVNSSEANPDKRLCPSNPHLPVCTDDSSSASVTPASTPSSTPYKLHTPGTPSTPGQTLTPGSDYSSSSGLDSPLQRNLKRRHKTGRTLFGDSTTPTKRGLGARTNPLGAAWAKDYHEADSNAYSRAILEYVDQRLSSTAERNYRIPPTCLTRSSLCRVVLFDHDDKGLESSIRLSAKEVVTEVRGKFLLLEEYEHYVDPLSESIDSFDLIKARHCGQHTADSSDLIQLILAAVIHSQQCFFSYNRYVLFYRGFGDRTIVVDATQYGNNARFVRRSCIPNCRLEHCIVQDKLQLVIRTSTEIMPGTELTIPFDLDYYTCHYPLDCACARSRCPVLKWSRKLIRKKVVPNLDYSKYIESQLRVLSKPLTQDSPNSRSSSGDLPGLTGSPIIRTAVGNSLSGYVHSHPSPTSIDRSQKETLKQRFESVDPPIIMSSKRNPLKVDASVLDDSTEQGRMVDEVTRPVVVPEISGATSSPPSNESLDASPAYPDHSAALSDKTVMPFFSIHMLTICMFYLRRYLYCDDVLLTFEYFSF
ncbi:uncharacterized protein DEA37_0006967 [Paragonimus westermani]|uniref:SET domain-containing protein n=1 Tax=Paragonimus westermani TaxID=34504 RepID=A0A5J4NZP5_9TREM|nr:uncharacterized protein DEA37_0006967 [Paragonimus westermani]